MKSGSLRGRLRGRKHLGFVYFCCCYTEAGDFAFVDIMGFKRIVVELNTSCMIGDDVSIGTLEGCI